MDTGIFNDNRYFDVFVEYAKASAEDICIRITAHNRGPEPAELHLLPTLWFRNTWRWNGGPRRPQLTQINGVKEAAVIEAVHDQYGRRLLLCEGTPELLFTENETNATRLYGAENPTRFVKDGIND